MSCNGAGQAAVFRAPTQARAVCERVCAAFTHTRDTKIAYIIPRRTGPIMRDALKMQAGWRNIEEPNMQYNTEQANTERNTLADLL